MDFVKIVPHIDLILFELMILYTLYAIQLCKKGEECGSDWPPFTLTILWSAIIGWLDFAPYARELVFPSRIIIRLAAYGIMILSIFSGRVRHMPDNSRIEKVVGPFGIPVMLIEVLIANEIADPLYGIFDIICLVLLGLNVFYMPEDKISRWMAIFFLVVWCLLLIAAPVLHMSEQIWISSGFLTNIRMVTGTCMCIYIMSAT